MLHVASYALHDRALTAVVDDDTVTVQWSQHTQVRVGAADSCPRCMALERACTQMGGREGVTDVWMGSGAARQWHQFTTYTSTEWSSGGGGGTGHGRVVAPMPGRVVGVDVEEGAAVVAGQRLVVVEAMKMEHSVKAPCDGVVVGLAVSVGGQVQDGDVLLTIKPEASSL